MGGLSLTAEWIGQGWVEWRRRKGKGGKEEGKTGWYIKYTKKFLKNKNY